MVKEKKDKKKVEPYFSGPKFESCWLIRYKIVDIRIPWCVQLYKMIRI
jgi:hypothetical protein